MNQKTSLETAPRIIKNFFISIEKDRRLRDLNAKTRVPISEYIREGIDYILKKYNA